MATVGFSASEEQKQRIDDKITMTKKTALWAVFFMG